MLLYTCSWISTKLITNSCLHVQYTWDEVKLSRSAMKRNGHLLNVLRVERLVFTKPGLHRAPESKFSVVRPLPPKMDYTMYLISTICDVTIPSFSVQLQKWCTIHLRTKLANCMLWSTCMDLLPWNGLIRQEHMATLPNNFSAAPLPCKYSPRY